MKIKNWIAKRILVNGALLGLLAMAAVTPVSAGGNFPDHSNEPGDIVETAVGAGQFKTLAAALEAAGLIDALKGSGPFTVFAPTDAAFAKLPAGTVQSLLLPENKEKLKAILLYHVLPMNVMAEQVMGMDGQSVKTLQGSSIKLRTKNGVRVDNAKVTQTDIKASNGVIHVIDTVLMPKM